MTSAPHPATSGPWTLARRPWKGRLAVRFAAGLGLGALVVLVGAAWWSLRVHREGMTGLVQLSADRGADITLRSTRDAMLRNDPEGVRRIVDAIGKQPGFHRIRILDKEGTVRVSTRAGEEGSVLSPDAETCVVCHRTGHTLERPERGERIRMEEDPDAGRLLAVVLPIPNEPDCSTADCHAHRPEQRVLGVLEIEMSLGFVDARLAASEREMAIGIVGAVAGMLAFASLLVWALVVRPVRRLENAMGVAAAGDLSVRAPVTSRDEMGDLTGAWNSLVADLERARQELEEWNRTLESRVDHQTQELEKAHRNILVVERMASLGKLAAVVAHEINNPLAGIATYAKLLRKRLAKQTQGAPSPSEADTERALELVETEAVRCGEIVKNLLLFSRTPSARFEEADLKPFVDRCVLLVRHQADLQRVTIHVEVEPDLPRIVCDGAQVQQALLALATNAIEAMPSGGALAIRLKRQSDPALGIVLEVADTGVGIAPGDLARIYEPFFTTKEQGKGVGLGLAVVYGIVTRHHGVVDVESAPGRGTTFRIRLPLVQPAAPVADALAPGEPS